MDDYIPEIREMEREVEEKTYCTQCGEPGSYRCSECWDELPAEGAEFKTVLPTDGATAREVDDR